VDLLAHEATVSKNNCDSGCEIGIPFGVFYVIEFIIASSFLIQIDQPTFLFSIRSALKESIDGKIMVNNTKVVISMTRWY